MDELTEKKGALRKRTLAVRDALSPEVRAKKSEQIRSLLFQLPEFVSAGTVMFFISFRSEVMTEGMIKGALALGKRVVVPVTDLDHRRLILSALEDFERDLAVSTYGILEPKREKVKEVRAEELDLIIAPGSVFDERGGRIGYGGGYYDELLGRVSGETLVAALAFQFQVVDEVPVREGHDIPVHKIITEERVIECRK